MGAGSSSAGGSSPRTDGSSSIHKIFGGKPDCFDCFVEQKDCPSAAKDVNYLPRGGVHVTLLSGSAVQFGIPPNTIKDSMKYGLPVPDVFVIVGDEMFDRQMSINTAEFEFPAYFNYFVRGKPTTIVCFNEVAKRVRTIFQETLLGPTAENCRLTDDFDPKISNDHYPNFWVEGLALDPKREQLKIEQLLNFKILDPSAGSKTRGMCGTGPSVLGDCSPSALFGSLTSKSISRSSSGNKVSLIKKDYCANAITSLCLFGTLSQVILNDSKDNPVFIKYNLTANKYTLRENKRALVSLKGVFVRPNRRLVEGSSKLHDHINASPLLFIL